MNEASATCSLNAIERFLDDNLTADEQNRFEIHLDHCDNCCESLRRMTADAEQWSLVQDNLGDAFDGPRSERSGHSLDFLNPTDDPRMLGRFAGYEIAGVIGSGGMGLVLKGFDQALNRYVAIKVLLPHYATNAAARKRFAREARAAAAVVHENVIEIYGVSVEENKATLPYLVMPYIRGESLQKRLDRCGVLPTAETLRIAMQIASGLAAAHEQGLVHRDIKPANILLPEDVERVTITDFGLARAADDASLTRTGVVAGTPQYMSPEQAEGGRVTGQSDLFSLGSVMYSICTGRVPFRAETPLGMLRRIVDDDPRPIRQINPEVPEWLCRIIDKLHAKTPDARFDSADEVAQLLKQCLSHMQQPEMIPLPRDVEPRRQKTQAFGNAILRNRMVNGVLIMMSALMLGIIGWTFLETSPEPPKAPLTGLVTQVSQPFKKQFTATFANPSEIGTLNVDIKRGSISIVGHDKPSVIIELEVPNYSPGSTNSDGLRELRPNNLDFDIVTEDNQIKVDSNSRRYITNLQIKVPRHSHLVLDSYGGELRVTRVHGHLDARSFHGDVILTECSGTTDLYSYHGNLVASLNSINADLPLEFESYNGSVDLILPAEVQLNTQLGTVHGKLLTDFDITETGDPVRENVQKNGTKNIEFEKLVHGTINGGGQVLKIETQHGDIRLRRQKTDLGVRLGKEWNEPLGAKLGKEWNERLGAKLGEEWNQKLGKELGAEWNARLNPESVPQQKAGEPAIQLPTPTGSHSVGTTSREWTDHERRASHKSPGSGPRRLVVQIWYPSIRDSRALPAKYDAFSEGWKHVAANSTLRPQFAEGLSNCPLILICPGRGVNHRAYTTLAESLASQGYVVASAGMPGIGHVAFSDGQIINPDPGFRPSRALMSGPYELVDEFFEVPTNIGRKDLEFVVRQLRTLNEETVGRFFNRIDLNNIGLFGHSLGGRIAGAFAAENADVQAYISMEGIAPRRVRFDGLLNMPVAMMCSSGTLPYAKNNYQTLIDGRAAVKASSLDGDAYFVVETEESAGNMMQSVGWSRDQRFK